jgi:uncharacterized protein (UPF0332 family)
VKKIIYNPRQKKRASSLMALGTSERDAAQKLIEAGLYRETVVHLYFTCFYVSQAMLCHVLPTNPTHGNVQSSLHKTYGRSPDFPRRYIELHTFLHDQRNEFDYRTTHTPDPDALKHQLATLSSYVKFAMSVVPRVEVLDLLRAISFDNPDRIRDFSFDIYCPKTYSHHTRLTFWQPPFYLDIFGVSQLIKGATRLLRGLRVRRTTDYVVGLVTRHHLQSFPHHWQLLPYESYPPQYLPLHYVSMSAGRHFCSCTRAGGRKSGPTTKAAPFNLQLSAFNIFLP